MAQTPSAKRKLGPRPILRSTRAPAWNLKPLNRAEPTTSGMRPPGFNPTTRHRFTLFTDGDTPSSGTRPSSSEPNSSTNSSDPPDATRDEVNDSTSDPDDDEDEVSTPHPDKAPEPTPKRRKTLDILRVVRIMKRDNTSKKVSDEIKAWNMAARNLGRELTVFLRAAVAFGIGLDVNLQDDSDTSGDEDSGGRVDQHPLHMPQMSADQKAELEQQCQVILASMPNLHADIDALLERPTSLSTYATYIDKRVRAARGDDLNSLQRHFLKFIAALPENEDLSVPHHIAKRDRGFFNRFTGRLLCPQDDLPAFDADPVQYCTEARNGNGPSADDLPSFLFDPAMAEEDPDDPLAGFLCGPFLEMARCFKCLYTGPASALKDLASDEKGPGRPPIFTVYGIHEVKACHIAYAAVLSRYLLNSQTQWSHKDSTFELGQFHSRVLEPFKSKTWATKILARFNKRVFGNSHPQVAQSSGPRPGSRAAKIAARITAQVAQEDAARLEGNPEDGTAPGTS
ncbi:hypothetical protein C8Q79DRAFT_928002 [Trametes meyenii]|nr:hypothetical protein C8Q79DRAFT_928002 [Trametes meyenii]